MWIYEGKEFTQEMVDLWFGFVYLIINLENNKKYVGKKLFSQSKPYQKNGKKKKRRVPSDWEEYYGSSEELLKDVEELGKDKFKRTIIHLCKTRGMCSYLEAREQMDRRVIESDDYYNRYIQVRINQNHIKF
jgi:hypothetical protein